MTEHLPVKDDEDELPVASVWRPTLTAIVDALRKGDYQLSSGVASVAEVADDTAAQMAAYVADYGEKLASLSEETWESSVSLWMEDYWEVFVDLWTVESGRSDMVLACKVFEDGPGYRVEITSIHVP